MVMLIIPSQGIQKQQIGIFNKLCYNYEYAY